MKCTRHFHKNIQSGEKNVGLHKGKHSSPCSSNSIWGPSISEEHQLEEMGRDLLLDKDGNFHPDDMLIFTSDPTRDGDSKVRNRLVREQAKIIGAAAMGQSGNSAGCVTHVTKNLNNDMCKIKRKIPVLGVLVGLKITEQRQHRMT